MKNGNMVLILSTLGDQTTTSVIRWLLYFGVSTDKIVRVNDTDLLRVNRIALSEKGLSTELRIQNSNYNIKLHEVESYWYRRGQWRFAFEKTGSYGLDVTLRKEISGIERFINDFLRRLPTRIGCYYENEVNKLTCLLMANNIGLKIPKTLITALKEAVDMSTRASKAITDIMQCRVGDKILGVHTILLDEETFNTAPTVFFPTLFQQYIQKSYELRIFYLHGELYPMAIFSQNNEKTRIDFRHYDRERPNRTVPYKLPRYIQSKLLRLMKLLKFSSGSIDMVVDEMGDYYFLEVNPIGQFEQVSFPCNYFLEREVARRLYLK